MKKTVFALLLIFAVLLSFAGCGKTPGQEVQTTTEATQPTEPVLTVEEQQILTQRREFVVQQMRDLMTVLWRTDEDVTYSKNRKSEGLENDPEDKITTLKAGRLYSGVPYTHGNGSIYDWIAFATERDENGIYHLSGLSTDLLTGVDTMEPNRRARLGNDCADAVSWAWGFVSPTMNFTQTYDMTEANGCVKVGDFVCDPVKHSHTKEVTQQNGMEVMCKAYAQLQPGDAVVHNNSPESHAMLISQVHVVTDSKGNLDMMNSYVNVIHQTSGYLYNEKTYYDSQLGEMVYYCGGVDDEYLFIDLFNGGYLPFTCVELIDPAPIEEPKIVDSELTLGADNIASGMLTSNYVMSYVTITVTDESGTEVQKGVCFVVEAELKNFDIGHFTMAQEQDVMIGKIAPEELKAGNYHCTLVVKLATGADITVRDFDFTV